MMVKSRLVLGLFIFNLEPFIVAQDTVLIKVYSALCHSILVSFSNAFYTLFLCQNQY